MTRRDDGRMIQDGWVWLMKNGDDGAFCSMECYMTDGSRYGQSPDDITPRLWPSPGNSVALAALNRLCCDTCGINLADMMRDGYRERGKRGNAAPAGARAE